ncbi:MULTISPECIES: hypothetical protein [Leptospira]|uniref:Uncharacterized protein n=5 Tax=Leptospira borgpetersenii TaxID=174 RepID=M3HMW5_LEPBO|nr:MULTISPECIES: hypothetical protein [Leptospira]EMF99410.1 hypothetical protein LEP1GSC123_4838 [Leptospira borgpetersenii str. 200701203]ALO24553.1 hypothetical protein LBBP_00186 [Leptospira borgpetersenii serovar Ballum]ANG99695.1 Uncharacterized protein LB4E_0161 [Leptospira borgpetersenii str. 4E]AXX14316.1 hypothetical protein C4Q31_00840 [Leptospira borgpetersenii serovar Ceylonica]EKP13153.1 hypothetical protein LEP1GSC128_3475 [Leptospira borgpetersenii str. 200801926]
MTTNLCIQCNQKESMRQTDLCEECLIENFKPLILLSNEIRSLNSSDTGNTTPEEPKATM